MRHSATPRAPHSPISPIIRLAALCLLALSLASGCANKNLATSPDACPVDSERLPAGARAEIDPELLAKLDALGIDLNSLTPEERAALLSDTGLKFRLDAEQNEEAQRWFWYFTHKARPSFERWMARATPYLPHVRQALKDKGLPEDLIVLPLAESGYNNWAVSRSGAVGMWQFMPATGQRFGLKTDWWLDERRDPWMSTRAAMDYLGFLNGKFNDWYLALAAYNAGEGRIARAMEQTGCDNFFDLADGKPVLAGETRSYVPKFLALLKIYRNLEKLGFQPVDPNCAPPQLAEVEIPPGADLENLAGALNMRFDDFQGMNPAFRRSFAPPSGRTRVMVPAAKLQVAQAWATNRREPFAGMDRLVARKGDAWPKIAKRFDVPVEILRVVNPGLPDGGPRPGDLVTLPFKNATPQLAAADLERERERARQEALKPEKPARGIKVAMNDRGSGKSKTPDAKTPAPVQVESKAASPADLKDSKRALAEQRSNYVVQQGDTMFSIAKSKNVSLETLMAANGLKTPSIAPGQKLYIPGAEPAAKTAAAQLAPQLAAKPEPKAAVKAESKTSAKPEPAKPAPAAPAAPKVASHQVQKGDTVFSIARKYGTDPKTIVAMNKLDPASCAITPGSTLKIALP